MSPAPQRGQLLLTLGRVGGAEGGGVEEEGDTHRNGPLAVPQVGYQAFTQMMQGLEDDLVELTAHTAAHVAHLAAHGPLRFGEAYFIGQWAGRLLSILAYSEEWDQVHEVWSVDAVDECKQTPFAGGGVSSPRLTGPAIRHVRLLDQPGQFAAWTRAIVYI
jgi:hypothetical protein